MRLPKLQYISDGATFDDQYKNILSALDAGIKWIQLRWKNASRSEILILAEKIKPICDQYQSILIINDYPDIAQSVNAHGVHLGLKDLSISEARIILHAHQWIGGTSNNLDDVKQRILENVTYIGLGPLRFTTTKSQLSPILGFEGYQMILSQLPDNKIPIYAIGGIHLDDIPVLRNIGLYGIAVSSLINQSKNKTQLVQQINQYLYGTA
ncbi:MAG: thiamine phosphate synthase [Bacteroidia bacterium]